MNSIAQFNTQSFIIALKAFFEELKVPVNYLANEPTSAIEVLGENYKANNEAHKLIADVYALGIVNDAIFEGTEEFKNLAAVKTIKGDYNGLLIFGVALENRQDGLLPTRSQLAEISRAFNRTFPYTPVTIIFKYNHLISFANSERIKYKQEWREGEKVGKVSLLMNVDCSLNEDGKSNIHQGHFRILKAISVDAIKEYDRRNKVTSYTDLYRGWQNVFNTSVLNEQFYKDYQALSVKIIRAIYPKKVKDKLKAHQGALNLLNRMMFVYFIQKKGWLMNDPEFMFHFWQDYNESKSLANSFHEKWLNKVFFKAFNGKAFNDPEIFKLLPKKYHASILEFPYLNGGLFTSADEDDFILDDVVFEEVFNFLQGYIFTISEDTADEINLEINPELLGKMYEGMINATDLNDVDAENGIVYTERPEINFMTRRSFVEVLNKKLGNGYSRDFLYHFCFDKPVDKLELLKRFKINANELKIAILSITALDPSCGSGSMLIGVIQLQVELISCLDKYIGKPHTAKDDFYLKKQIISESIYGVDIKEWAVRIAELRFWLYMIADAEFTTNELIVKPLLPNLDFKLRQGNSLLQEIGNLDFSIKGLFNGRKRNVGASKRLNDFIKKKKEFITNQAESETSYKKLKDEELFVFKEFIKELVFENANEIKRLSKGNGQQDIFGSEKKGNLFEEQIQSLEKENEQFQKILNSIKTKGRLPFSYDIDFMEIFLTKEDAGFDLIIGNPPYVRQEDILPAEDSVELERLLLPENKLEKAEISKAYKEKLSAKVYETFPFLKTKAKTQIDGRNKTIDIYGSKVPGRSDLYVYFQLLCPALLNNNGTFCFIISNSWLDVEYGGYIQQFLLKHTQLHAIYDCNVRSFSASVNTIIYLHSTIHNNNLTDTQYKTLKPSGNNVKFVMNKADYGDIAYAPLLIEQEHCVENTFRQHYRIITKNPFQLWDEGYDEENYSYQSNKWGGKYLRAPEIYFTILEKGKDKLVQLKQIAEVKFGVKTGANEFFYLDKEKQDTFKIEKRFLKKVIKSPRDFDSILIPENQLSTVAFNCNEVKSKLKGSNALKYIEWGEKSKIIDGTETRAFQKRPSCNRTPWHSFEEIKGNTFWGKELRERLAVFCCDEVVIADCRLYVSVLTKKQQAILNSTISIFIDETLGRQLGGGGGPRSVMVYEIKNLTVINADLVKSKRIETLFEKLSKRKVLPFIQELGFNNTIAIREQKPNPLNDRKELDDIIFDELGLSQSERNEVYWATAELIKQRLDKAATR